MATAEKVLQINVPRAQFSLLDGISKALATVFGCWHREVSRPFTRQGKTFRTCLGCGAHQRFDLSSWQSRGGFYHGRA